MLTIEFRLLAIGGDITWFGPGWYMNTLADEEDPLWFTLYVGQADGVWERIRHHRNHYKTDKSLHYHHWRQPHRRSTFVLLGKLTKGLTKEGQIQSFLNHIVDRATLACSRFVMLIEIQRALNRDIHTRPPPELAIPRLFPICY